MDGWGCQSVDDKKHTNTHTRGTIQSEQTVSHLCAASFGYQYLSLCFVNILTIIGVLHIRTGSAPLISPHLPPSFIGSLVITLSRMLL